jgi:hypothetical protein
MVPDFRSIVCTLSLKLAFPKIILLKLKDVTEFVVVVFGMVTVGTAVVGAIVELVRGVVIVVVVAMVVTGVVIVGVVVDVVAGEIIAFVVDIGTDIVFDLGVATAVQALEIKIIRIKDKYIIRFITQLLMSQVLFQVGLINAVQLLKQVVFRK